MHESNTLPPFKIYSLNWLASISLGWISTIHLYQLYSYLCFISIYVLQYYLFVVNKSFDEMWSSILRLVYSIQSTALCNILGFGFIGDWTRLIEPDRELRFNRWFRKKSGQTSHESIRGDWFRTHSNRSISTCNLCQTWEVEIANSTYVDHRLNWYGNNQMTQILYERTLKCK